MVGLSSDRMVEQKLRNTDMQLDLLLHLVAQGNPDSSTVELLWTWVLRRKGAALDAGCRFREARSVAAADPQFAARVRAFREVKQHLADLEVRPPAGISREQLLRVRQKLRADEDRLSGELKQELASAARVTRSQRECFPRRRPGEAAALHGVDPVRPLHDALVRDS